MESHSNAGNTPREEDDVTEHGVTEHEDTENHITEHEVTDSDPEELNSIFDMNIDTDDELINVPSQSGLNNVGPEIINLDFYRCIVCKVVPFKEVYECQNKHTFCAGCYQMRVLDKSFVTQMGTCPECNVKLYRHRQGRNRPVERFLAETLVACEQCGIHLMRGSLRHHGRMVCSERLVACKYKRVGCLWKGVAGVAGLAVTEHENSCLFRSKKGHELVEYLRQRQAQGVEKQLLLGKIMKLMQLPHIKLRLLQLLPKVEGLPCNQQMTADVFEAFGHRWSVLINCQLLSNPDDPNNNTYGLFSHLSMDYAALERESLFISYTLLNGTYSDVRFQPNLCENIEFSSNNWFGPLTLLYKNSWQNCAKLINERGFFARIMLSRL